MGAVPQEIQNFDLTPVNQRLEAKGKENVGDLEREFRRLATLMVETDESVVT